MNTFDSELHDLIDKWRDQPGYSLAEMIEELQRAAFDLGGEISEARALAGE
jgi:hypothetical protein